MRHPAPAAQRRARSSSARRSGTSASPTVPSMRSGVTPRTLGQHGRMPLEECLDHAGGRRLPPALPVPTAVPRPARAGRTSGFLPGADTL